MDTEFYGDTYMQTLETAAPYADIFLDGNQWFEPSGGRRAQAKGKKGNNYRFRFALVIDAPAAQPTPSGKIISELSDEIWLSSFVNNQVIFRQGTYNKMAMN
ncbi:hypothetical protein [Hymenobacter sp. HSC-4F20]|uniref:hypothetical protein n=1 Tax=Hymenobacter sp. HSC-4F20 TaxID=2864135 RepID=UPI001C73A3C6|nr:hypothetical protein [Hymenobacter sp. HSC-4F20]